MYTVVIRRILGLFGKSTRLKIFKGADFQHLIFISMLGKFLPDCKLAINKAVLGEKISKIKLFST